MGKTSQSISWHITNDSQIQGNLPSVCIFNLMGFQILFKHIYKEYTLPWSGWNKTNIRSYSENSKDYTVFSAYLEEIMLLLSRHKVKIWSNARKLLEFHFHHLMVIYLLVDCSASPFAEVASQIKMPCFLGKVIGKQSDLWQDCTVLHKLLLGSKGVSP